MEWKCSNTKWAAERWNHCNFHLYSISMRAYCDRALTTKMWSKVVTMWSTLKIYFLQCRSSTMRMKSHYRLCSRAITAKIVSFWMDWGKSLVVFESSRWRWLVHDVKRILRECLRSTASRKVWKARSYGGSRHSELALEATLMCVTDWSPHKVPSWRLIISQLITSKSDEYTLTSNVCAHTFNTASTTEGRRVAPYVATSEKGRFSFLTFTVCHEKFGDTHHGAHFVLYPCYTFLAISLPGSWVIPWKIFSNSSFSKKNMLTC